MDFDDTNFFAFTDLSFYAMDDLELSVGHRRHREDDPSDWSEDNLFGILSGNPGTCVPDTARSLPLVELKNGSLHKRDPFFVFA